MPKLTIYIPISLQARYTRLVSRANKGRAQIPRQASKIWVGENCFELRFRPKGDHTPWNKIQPVSETDPNSFNTRKSLMEEKAQQTKTTKEPTTTTNNIWLAKDIRNSPANQGMSFLTNPQNPNLIPVSKERSIRNLTRNLTGETLLPKGVITSNRFNPLIGMQVSSP